MTCCGGLALEAEFGFSLIFTIIVDTDHMLSTRQTHESRNVALSSGTFHDGEVLCLVSPTQIFKITFTSSELLPKTSSLFSQFIQTAGPISKTIIRYPRVLVPNEHIRLPGRHLLNMPESSGSSFASSVSIFNEEDQRSPDKSQGILRICPHQELSWERFHRIANLLNTKTADDVDVMTKVSTHRGLAETMRKILTIHPLTCPTGHYRTHNDMRECYIRIGEVGVNVLGSGFFSYEASEAPGTPGSLVLNVFWSVQTATIGQKHRQSKEKLGERLEKTGVWLCPHNKLSDPLMIERSWELLHPSDDPVDRYEAKQSGDTWDWCKKCHTGVNVEYVKSRRMPSIYYFAKRYLGEGQAPNDPKWRRQCRLPSSSRET